MHNQFKTQKFKHLMLAMGPRDLNSAPNSPVHCSSHSMTSFQSSELTELPVVENSQLFAQRAHSAGTAHGTPPQGGLMPALQDPQNWASSQSSTKHPFTGKPPSNSCNASVLPLHLCDTWLLWATWGTGQCLSALFFWFRSMCSTSAGLPSTFFAYERFLATEDMWPGGQIGCRQVLPSSRKRVVGAKIRYFLSQICYASDGIPA